jgi:hypothetical protein
MPSPVTICSGALLKLGDQPITSLADDSTRALIVSALYPDVRRAVIRAHPWNATTKRFGPMAPLAEAPAFGYECQFQLPDDCIRVFDTDLGKDYPFKVEGRKLLIDSNVVSILYAFDEEDPSQWDSLLVEAVTARLAAEAAIPVTANSRLSEQMWALFANKMREATGTDGQEGTPSPVTSDVLIDCR